ncbi:SDR family oxidoreductase [Sphingobium sp.]|uniref:SDR family oxidoreductase n=1 Tax=Sphingobium sp. TaxID=1912891 RepID=UPI0028BE126B|nr:SDR family oxidoreductase [Sphingobium sp.]
MTMETADLMLRPGIMAGQNILITGGGSGLGRAMAETFLMLGARVHICGRRQGVLDAAAAELSRRTGGSIIPHGCDIRDDLAVEAMLDTIWAGSGPLTGLVNNAAGNFISRTEDLSMRGFDAITNIVFRGAFGITHNCGRRWIAGGDRASVLSIVATWVWNGSPYTVPSAMAKSGINAMVQSLAVEWGGKGIRLNAIAPGPFPTEGVRKRLRPGMSEDEADRDAGADNPMGRVGRLPEFTNLAAFLMSPGSDYINGQTIAIDGGRHLATGGNFSSLRSWSDADWENARQSIRATDSMDKSRRG